MDELSEVKFTENEAVIVGLVEDLESSESAEYVLNNREHFTSLRASQAIAELLPHLLNLLFVG